MSQKETERAQEIRLKKLSMDLQTIDVLAQHLLADLRGERVEAAKLNAARHLGEAVQRITELYR